MQFVVASDGTEVTRPYFDVPARELFIWAVLINRLDIAKVFWEEGMVSIVCMVLPVYRDHLKNIFDAN